MKRSAILKFAAACFLLAGLRFPDEARAQYIDPGTGSFMLQCLIGGILGILFSLKVFWGKIKAFFATKAVKQKKEIQR